MAYDTHPAPDAPVVEQSVSTPHDDFIVVRDLVVEFGPNRVVDHVSFAIHRGEQLSLLGPSGCGKTTTLRCIAGLETPVSGEISVDGRVVFSSERGINIPSDKRDLSLMFQSYAIWPHMSVYDNVAYGLKVRKVPRREIRERVGTVLAMVGMQQFADTPATRLSGGQQQRVALARSYAYPPKALLLDEPLSNLDARLRDQVRRDLIAFQRETGVTTIYVTHDQEEAMALSDRIIVMSQGVIVQDDSPLAVYQEPKTRFVADFIGAANIVKGTLTSPPRGPALDLGDGVVLHCKDTTASTQVPRTAEACIRTVYPSLSKEQPAEAVNVWPATVRQSIMLGDFAEMTIDWPGGELRVKALSVETFDEGEAVYLSLNPQHVVLLEDSAKEGGQ